MCVCVHVCEREKVGEIEERVKLTKRLTDRKTSVFIVTSNNNANKNVKER